MSSAATKIEDYDVIDVIGSGSFGTCFKVRHKLSEALFVWKAVDYGKLSEESKQNLVYEVNLLSQLNHPNIVKYYDRIIHKETTTLYIITEWCQGGDLAKLIKSAKSTGQLLREPFVWRMLYQVSKAVQVCHTTLGDFAVLHRDIKPANVFLDENGNAKLGDFGLARVTNAKDECGGSLVGTSFYMSPEVVRGQRYNRKSDIWALGCLVYELCTLAPPFNGRTMTDLLDSIESGKYAPIPSHYSANLVKVISFMLSVKHEYRPTIEMILHHPLVVQNVTSIHNPSAQRRIFKDAIKENACEEALKNLSLSTEAEDVTQNLFKDKWFHRLEALREREAQLKQREEGLAAKERSLMSKERQLVLQERKVKNRLSTVEPTHRSRQETQLNVSGDTEFSADPGDTSVLPTSAKMNLSHFPRPLFTDRHSTTRTKSVPAQPHSNSSSGKSHSSDNSTHSRQPLKESFSLNRNAVNKSLKRHSDSRKLLNAEIESANWKSKFLRNQSTRRSTANFDTENVAAGHQEVRVKDGVKFKSNAKPSKTFKLIRFI